MAPRTLETLRPKTFLRFMSLRTGAELIMTSLLINKVSGVYGILALFTGYDLNLMQLSMYIYSIVALACILVLFPSIRTQEPFRCLCLAYLYGIDSIINAMYTAAFSVAWFMVLASHPENAGKTPGAGMMNDTAGFTNPTHTVEKVDVIASPAPGLQPAQEAVAYGHGESSTSPLGLGSAIFQSGGIMSLSAISALWLLRVYFSLVMFSFARSALRQHIATTSTDWQATSGESGLAENPFSEHRDRGAGWKGKLGRTMLSLTPGYWLGPDEEGEWARGISGRFRKSVASESSYPPGVHERERRRRSGTGPPAPAVRLADLAAQPR